MDYPDLLEKLKELTKAPIQVQPAVVKKVDEAAFTCDVEFLSGAELSDVRLKAAIDELPDGVVEVPEVDSSVLVGIIGNTSNQCFVLKCSKVAKIIGKIETTEFEIDKDKATLKVDAAEVKVEKNGEISLNDGSLNDGSKGGMIIWSKLKADLNKLKEFTEAIKQGFTNWTVAPQDGGAALKTAMGIALTGKTLPTFSDSDIVNDKIKHGT
ncbi:MAG: hypothetical protein EAZ92_00625 [Candidatus Kapaibacterium sp.]|nr:MAG: hypothetical protein EAZ92_00625 [Candidatus Kapabacteria bacterium]